MSEKRFIDFKTNLIEELTNNDWGTKAYFYLCQSFYDIFIEAFKYIPNPDYKLYTDERERNSGLHNGYYISNKYFTPLSNEEKKVLVEILKKAGSHYVANIATNRGHGYMIFEDYDFKKRKNRNESPVMIYSNSPTGRDEHIPRLVINQLAPKTFAILPLKNIKETEFKPNDFSFSFGIPYSVFSDYSGIGDIFFFNNDGLEFSRLNIVDVFNSHKDKVNDVGNTFKRTNLKESNISLFQEDSFIYSVDVIEKAYGSYLKEKWSSFKGRIDFRNNKWLELEGSSSVECFK